MAQLAAGITGRLAGYLDELAAGGAAPILYVHGDTTTAMAGGVAAFSGGHGLVHVEAGLRTLSPKPEVLREWTDGMRANDLDWATYAAQTAARASLRARQPGALARAVQHPGRRRRLAPARRAHRAEPGVPDRRGLRPGLDRRGVQLGGRRGRAVPRPRRRPGAVRDLPGAGERPVHPVLRPPAREHHRRVPVPGADELHGAPARGRPPDPLHPPPRHRGRDQAVRDGVLAPGARRPVRRAVRDQPGLGELRPGRARDAALRGDRDRLRQHPGGGQHPRGPVRDAALRLRPRRVAAGRRQLPGPAGRQPRPSPTPCTSSTPTSTSSGGSASTPPAPRGCSSTPSSAGFEAEGTLQSSEEWRYGLTPGR